MGTSLTMCYSKGKVAALLNFIAKKVYLYGDGVVERGREIFLNTYGPGN